MYRRLMRSILALYINTRGSIPRIPSRLGFFFYLKNEMTQVQFPRDKRTCVDVEYNKKHIQKYHHSTID